MKFKFISYIFLSFSFSINSYASEKEFGKMEDTDSSQEDSFSEASFDSSEFSSDDAEFSVEELKNDKQDKTYNIFCRIQRRQFTGSSAKFSVEELKNDKQDKTYNIFCRIQKRQFTGSKNTHLIDKLRNNKNSLQQKLHEESLDIMNSHEDIENKIKKFEELYNHQIKMLAPFFNPPTEPAYRLSSFIINFEIWSIVRRQVWQEVWKQVRGSSLTLLTPSEIKDRVRGQAYQDIKKQIDLYFPIRRHRKNESVWALPAEVRCNVSFYLNAISSIQQELWKYKLHSDVTIRRISYKSEFEEKDLVTRYNFLIFQINSLFVIHSPEMESMRKNFAWFLKRILEESQILEILKNFQIPHFVEEPLVDTQLRLLRMHLLPTVPIGLGEGSHTHQQEQILLEEEMPFENQVTTASILLATALSSLIQGRASWNLSKAPESCGL